MNLVYPLASGADQTEIRLSLRSVEKFLRGVDEIYVLGTEPVPGTVHIFHPDPHPRPTANTYLKCRKACELFDRFLWMNDDIYFTRPIHVEEIPLIRNGRLPNPNTKFKEESRYRDELRNTCRYLKSIGATTYSFEVHAPMPIVSEVFLRVTSAELCASEKIVLWRSVYGNLCGFPSVDMGDNKVYAKKRFSLEKAQSYFFVSSCPEFHPELRRWLTELLA